MNVRRPECDEHPANPICRYALLKKLTMLDGVMAAAAFGPDNWPHGDGGVAPGGEGGAEIGMHSDNPAGFLLRGVVPELDDRANIP